MPITFKSRHSPNIIMLDAAGHALIRLMGHSGTVPGSLAAEDVPEALSRLEAAVAADPDRPLEPGRGVPGDDDEEREPPVSVAKRALPLIEMLRTAAAEQDYVMWDD